MPTFATFYTHSRILKDYNYSRQETRDRDYQSFLDFPAMHGCNMFLFDLLIQADVLLAVRAIVREEEQWYPRLLSLP